MKKMLMKLSNMNQNGFFKLNFNNDGVYYISLKSHDKADVCLLENCQNQICSTSQAGCTQCLAASLCALSQHKAAAHSHAAGLTSRNLARLPTGVHLV
jgi:hypothetical protein